MEAGAGAEGALPGNLNAGQGLHGPLCGDCVTTPAAATPSGPGGGFLWNLFDTSDFPARWNCGEWTAGHGWLHIISDLGVWSAYMAIPIALAYFIRHRRDVPFPTVFWLFVAFIFACGTTHLIEAIIFYWPIYRAAGVVKLATALVSWATVAAMIPVIPRALALPGLQKYNQQLEQEIRERHKYQEALERANAELEVRNSEMEQFVYCVSHDLKSPVVTIAGALGLVQEEMREGRTADVDELLDAARKTADRMARTINELLQLSRVGRVIGEVKETDVTSMVREIVQMHQVALSEKGASVRVQEPLPTVIADSQRLFDVFENLISNALKYGCREEGGLIEVGGERREAEVRYWVRDRGPGVPPEQRERIFELFERLHQQPEGTGVGLAIVRRIVAVHGGRVWVESPPGGGATFHVSLPTTPPESLLRGSRSAGPGDSVPDQETKN